ncbi:unnamed protein product [Paramecium octaurelia]|uniref:Uncharacterized protein n=1 Tax=Paramecium octaurelia TaxID=43137 RepID=A0A8S1TXX1_PAROT|nr:unnamed protein product [Paramecium octaurelia]
MADLTTLRSQINQWTLDQDNKTFTKLDQMSTNLLTKFGAVSSDIRSVQHQANSIHAQINQAFNRFLTLSDSRFTEQRMAPPQEAPPKAAPPQNKDEGLSTAQKYTKALGIALQSLDLQQMAQDDDIFDDRDDKSISVFSAATTSGTVSKSVKLPAMFGTPQFNNNKFIGLFDDFDEAPIQEPVRQSAPVPAYRQSEAQPQQQGFANQQSQQVQPQAQQQIRQSIKQDQSQFLYSGDNNQFITRTNSALGNSMMNSQLGFVDPQQKEAFNQAFAPPYQQQQQQGYQPLPPPQTQRPTVVDAPPPPPLPPPTQQPQYTQPQTVVQQQPAQQFAPTLQDQLNSLIQKQREQNPPTIQQQPNYSTQQQEQPPIPEQRNPQQPIKVFQPPSVIGAPAYAKEKDKIMSLFDEDDDDDNEGGLFKSTTTNKNKFNNLLTDGVAKQEQNQKPAAVVIKEEEDQDFSVQPRVQSVKPPPKKQLFDETEEETLQKANADKIAAIYTVQQQQPKQEQPKQQVPPPKLTPSRNAFEDSDDEKKKEPQVPVKQAEQLAVSAEEPQVRPSIQQLQNRLNLNMFMKPPGEQVTMKDIKKNEKEHESEFVEQQAERPIVQKKKARGRQALDFDDDDSNKKSNKPAFVIKERTQQTQKAEVVIDRTSYRESIKLSKQTDFEVPITLEVKTEKKDIQVTISQPTQQLPSLSSNKPAQQSDPLAKKNIGKEFEQKGLPNFFNDPLGGGGKKQQQQPVQISNLPGFGGKSNTQTTTVQAAVTPTIAKPQRKNMFSDEEEDAVPKLPMPGQRNEQNLIIIVDLRERLFNSNNKLPLPNRNHK